MAAPFPRVGATFGDTSLAEDVSQIIYQITPEDTPFFNSIGSTRARSVVHEWQTRSLNTRQVNANPEGFTYSFTGENVRTARVVNFTQILKKEIRVSETLQAVDQHAIADMFAEQMQIAFTEAKTDAEHAYIRGTAVSGASDAAGQMNGFNKFMEDNSTSTYTNVSGTDTITEDIFNQLLETAWDAGGKPDKMLLNGPMKRKFSSFNSGLTRFIEADRQKQVNVVTHIETDFFPVSIALSRDVRRNLTAAGVTGHDIMIYDASMLARADLRPWTSRRTPEIADSMDGVVKTETTLEVGNANAHVYAADFLTGLANSD